MYLLVDGQVSGVISDIAQPIHISSFDQGHINSQHNRSQNAQHYDQFGDKTDSA